MVSFSFDRRRWPLVASLVLAPLTAVAMPVSTESSAALALSLDDARRRAAQVAPGVRLSLRRVAEAEAAKVGAGVWLPQNPTVNLDGRNGGSAGWGYGGGLQVLFDGFGAPQARVREANERSSEVAEGAQLSQLEATLDATQAYVAASLARREVAHAAEAIELARRLLAAANERQTAGAGNAVEVSSAQVELAERAADLHQATAKQSLEELRLRTLLRLRPGLALDLTTRIDIPAPARAPDALIADALEHAPDLKLLKARLASLEAQSERLRREARPKLGAYAAIDQAPQSAPFGILGLSVELPVAQRNQRPLAINDAERTTEQLREELVREQLQLSLTYRIAAYEQARQEAAVLGDSGIPTASERLRLVEEGWRAGRFDVFRVTTAAADLVRLKALRIEVLNRLWRERLELERLLGGPIDGSKE